MKVSKECRWCGKIYLMMPSRAKKNRGYCSRACEVQGRIKRERKVCPKCGQSWMAEKQSDRRKTYCSPRCFHQSRVFIRKQYFKAKCAYCGQGLWRWRFELRRNHSFCNTSCQMNYYVKMDGRKIIPPISFNHPNAIVNRFKPGSAVGRKYRFKKGLIPWNKGHEFNNGQRGRWGDMDFQIRYFKAIYKRDHGVTPTDSMFDKFILAMVLRSKIRRSLNA